uniref:Uncharacterized protein n=1 Tax=Romanomermis culicivorax TaxID=13658 RepID=A0A915J473_ROMCU
MLISNGLKIISAVGGKKLSPSSSRAILRDFFDVSTTICWSPPDTSNVVVGGDFFFNSMAILRDRRFSKSSTTILTPPTSSSSSATSGVELSTTRRRCRAAGVSSFSFSSIFSLRDDFSRFSPFPVFLVSPPLFSSATFSFSSLGSRFFSLRDLERFSSFLAHLSFSGDEDFRRRRFVVREEAVEKKKNHA